MMLLRGIGSARLVIGTLAQARVVRIKDGRDGFADGKAIEVYCDIRFEW